MHVHYSLKECLLHVSKHPINLAFPHISDQIFYPNDKTSLIKLREDLTMELLWIEQAIESRISVSIAL